MTALAGAIERKARELGVWEVVMSFQVNGETSEFSARQNEDSMTMTVSPFRAHEGDPGAFFEVRTKATEYPCGPVGGLVLLTHACAGAYLLAHESRRTIPWGPLREECTLADAVMIMVSTPAELDYAGIQGAHPRDRESATVYLEQMMTIGDPLGEVLALWLAGRLEERHVLGVVERREGEQLAELLNSNAEHAPPGGWRFVDCRCVDGVWQPTGHAYRPALVASPASE